MFLHILVIYCACVLRIEKKRRKYERKMEITASLLFAIGFIFLMTTLGASSVFFIKRETSIAVQAGFFGFASGVMVAASVWSLLLPALEEYGRRTLFPVTFGFLIGSAFLSILDKCVTRMRKTEHRSKEKALKLFLAITLHNVPEALAVGFAFGAAYVSKTPSALFLAIGMAIGIGVQNFPEGAAVALPMRESLKNRKKAFAFGVVSGIVEPIFVIMGCFLATGLKSVLPWLLSFAAGAMLFVVAEELMPEIGEGKERKFGAWAFVIGFIGMTVLDVISVFFDS